jgi:peptidoglycan/LPS O-acetylase OafA/YrhL
MTPRQQQYVPGLDLLRFFAACVVMVFHLAFWSWAYPEGQVARASRNVADFQGWADFSAIGWAGVQIFFVISGFVIAISGQHSTTFKFFQSRFVRLVPGVIVCASITFVAWILIDVGYTMHHIIEFTRSVLFHPMPPWIDSVYWTLGVEVFFYAVVFTLIALNRFDWIKRVMIVIGFVSTAFWVGYFASAAQGESGVFEIFRIVQWSRLSQLLLLQHGVFFAIGVLLWLQLMKRRTRDQSIWLCVFVIGGCLQIAAETHLKLDKTGFTVSPLLPCAIWLGSLVFFYLSVKYNARMHAMSPGVLQLFRRLGLMTYPLYLLHNVTGGAVMGTLARWGLPTTLALALAMTFILALSWWVSTAPEPMLQKLSRSVLSSVHSRWRASLPLRAP